MRVSHNVDLKPLNTFGIAAKAVTCIILETIEDIEVALEKFGRPTHILWAGSNILITQDIEWIIWHPKFHGIAINKKNNSVELTSWAWEEMNNVVHFATEHWLWGIENLIAIPGCVGAAPVQNIGAYGVELKDVFISCTAYDIEERKIKTFGKDECDFGYRNSIFKQNIGKYLIIEVSLRLSENPNPIINYGDVQSALEKSGSTNTPPTSTQIAQTIEQIRWSKLPRPSEIGNAGSFFKNPLVEKTIFDNLLEKYATMPHFLEEVSGLYKIPAAWLIEQAGLKWYRENNVGTHPNQPLVIVQYGEATGQEILTFSEKIITKVYDTFSVMLEREVNIR